MKKTIVRFLFSLGVIAFFVSISTPALSMGKRPTDTDEKKKELQPVLVKDVKAGSLRLQKAIFVPTGDQEALVEVEATCKSGKKLHVSTGTTGGDCSVDFDSETGEVSNVWCTDGQTGENSASATCFKGEGGTCTGSTGNGSCGETAPSH